MVTSRALVERGEESMRIISHEPDERPRSVQVYGVDPATVGAAVRLIASEDRADHVDLNFGCPVPKVTRRGGGAVLPWKRDLFRAIITAAVDAARPYGVPVTVKMRKGIDDDHLTYLEAGLVAQEVGVAAVALHARTAADYYSGTADWDAIAQLKATVTDIPVLGNGDIWSAEDALEMVAQTGCDGVVVGRGCQGRPWLFADLAAAFAGSDERIRPGLGYVATIVRRHAELMVEHFGDEGKALREMRKHMAWYFKGYVVGGETRAALGLVSTMAELDERLAAPRPGPGLPRGRRRGAARPRRVAQAPAAPVRLARLPRPVAGVREGPARGRAERLGRLTSSPTRRAMSAACDRSRIRLVRQTRRTRRTRGDRRSRRSRVETVAVGAPRSRVVTATAPAADARASAPSTGRPSSVPLSSPARNASPAPLVSTTSSTGAAGTSIQPSASSASAPARAVGADREPAPARDRVRQVRARVGQPRGADQQHVGGRHEVARVVGEAVVVVHVAPDGHPGGAGGGEQGAAVVGQVEDGRVDAVERRERAGARGRQLQVERDARAVVGHEVDVPLGGRDLLDDQRDPRVRERGADQRSPRGRRRSRCAGSRRRRARRA